MYQLTSKEEELIHENLKKIEVSLSETELNEQVNDLVQQLGYLRVTDTKGQVLHTTDGPVVTLINRQYNNGIYIFVADETSYYLRVIKPNTIDRSHLITQTIHRIEDEIQRIEMQNMDAYDVTQIYAHVIANKVIKPIAKQAYPEDKKKQDLFVKLYLPRFLANMARYYLADNVLQEEAVNSEPYIVKLMIEHTDTEEERMKSND